MDYGTALCFVFIHFFFLDEKKERFCRCLELWDKMKCMFLEIYMKFKEKIKNWTKQSMSHMEGTQVSSFLIFYEDFVTKCCHRFIILVACKIFYIYDLGVWPGVSVSETTTSGPWISKLLEIPVKSSSHFQILVLKFPN